MLCHNPSNTDASTRSQGSAADKAMPGSRRQLRDDGSQDPHGLEPQGAVQPELRGCRVRRKPRRFGATFAATCSIPNAGVRYPLLATARTVQDTTECYMFHADGSEAVLPIGKNSVTDPQGFSICACRYVGLHRGH